RLALGAPGLDGWVEREAVTAAIPEHFHHLDLARADAGWLGRHELAIVLALREAGGGRRARRAAEPQRRLGGRGGRRGLDGLARLVALDRGDRFGRLPGGRRRRLLDGGDRLLDHFLRRRLGGRPRDLVG